MTMKRSNTAAGLVPRKAWHRAAQPPHYLGRGREHSGGNRNGSVQASVPVTLKGEPQ